MSDREKLFETITGIMLDSGCYSENARQRILIAMEDYEISQRCTDIVVADETDNANVINRFILSKRVQGLSEKSIKQYARAARKFAEKMNIKLTETKANDIRLYTAYRMTQDGAKGRGLQNERYYLSAFFEWAVNDELMQRNPIKQVERLKLPKKQKKAFANIECEQLRGACKTLREKAIVEILFSTACRVGELVEIKMEDIDGDRIIVHGKGNKYAPVYLDSKAKYIVEQYILTRADDNPYLFPGRRKGTHTSSRNIEHIISDIGDRVGIKAHPHKFRRTTATIANSRGMGIEMVSKMLRHERIETTMQYLDLNEDELIYQHRKYVG